MNLNLIKMNINQHAKKINFKLIKLKYTNLILSYSKTTAGRPGNA